MKLRNKPKRTKTKTFINRNKLLILMKAIQSNERKELKKLTMRKLFIVYFMDNDNKGFSQNKIASDLYHKMGLKNPNSARVMIMRVLKDLKDNEFAYFVEEDYRNILKRKSWYLTDKGINYYVNELRDL